MSIQTEKFDANPKPECIPPVSRPEEREAAAERRRQFPYRFPVDRRPLMRRKLNLQFSKEVAKP